MLTLAERHQHILNSLKQEGQVNVLDLCEKLSVSSVTIRKDLKLLEDKGLLFRTHGGATANNPYTTDRSVNEKEKIQATEKTRIGAAAAALLVPNDSVLIASGTTVLALARNIQPKSSLTVITPSLNIALELNRHPDIEVMQLGGVLRKSSSSVTGPYAESTLTDFSCSKLFLGVDGIDLDFGLSTTNVMEAHLNRQMIKVSQKTIVLADSTKFGKRGFGKICGFEDIDQIITDSGISDYTVKTLEGMGIKVTIV
ncbi:DeoR/GlpR transcriptional regulator [Pontibacter sp. BT310]|uniref:DeoR/GlpR family DNA-binding transcription regulator n=1 Tax=Pontibacter populi TaxID=890055 RepID=A0ABS6XFH0_9BACT|nr:MULTISPECIES: DeoR/GlpR family DNA-binding transcription regulator [Pontibacter]MBJ6119419.1 DeoR/GlpR transcriptional regulator [Pontibacter sp. BT310]MBR0571847.1 DeoR/GlpR transcriptional regulator [Microvirga sp. STS03]MBW3366273.1 DeoR/GlpR family DNA-binding transcription regulator [Pontibacter populi]